MTSASIPLRCAYFADFANPSYSDLQISDWAPSPTHAHLLTRSLSYIRRLNASIGPRQTKCVIVDENAHIDFDDFVCVITTTRTPDVPSGSAFAVKTRTSMTWAKGNSCRVVVTTGVEWSKSSFIKGECHLIHWNCWAMGSYDMPADVFRALGMAANRYHRAILHRGTKGVSRRP